MIYNIDNHIKLDVSYLADIPPAL